jgi:hypothetical protein
VTSLAFLLCVESGAALERQSVLLVRSIRRFAGALAEAPIHAYKPREGPPLEEETVAELEELGAMLHSDPLNAEFPDDPMVNRVYVGLDAERRLDADVLVFCDSDAVFLAEPNDLLLEEGADVAVRPVGRVGKGSTGPGHENEDYWQRMYELAGVSERPFVETGVTGKRIRGYWQAGLVAMRRNAGLFERWLGILRTLMAEDHLQEGWRNPAIDQLTLAATISDRPERIKLLDRRYNYPLQRRALMDAEMQALDLDSVVHVHYHRWFNREGFLDDLDPPISRETDQYRWLDPQLPLDPVIHDALPTPKRPRGKARGRPAGG